jgi:hypothetical protein
MEKCSYRMEIRFSLFLKGVKMFLKDGKMFLEDGKIFSKDGKMFQKDGKMLEIKFTLFLKDGKVPPKTKTRIYKITLMAVTS